MNQAHHHTGLLFAPLPCAGHTHAIVPGPTQYQGSEESGQLLVQAPPFCASALLREAACVDAQKTKSLCCGAAGITSTISAHVHPQIPHHRLRQAAPADETLIASDRPHAQLVKGYTHLPSFAPTANEQAIYGCIINAINTTLSGSTEGVYSTVEGMALAIHNALMQSGTLQPEHRAAAWLGQAGLYRTRLDAVRNGEQLVQPLSVAQLIAHAQRHAYSQPTEVMP